nr:uncharacterized protein CI109_002784 [Kwoniella shandongensis]KAA5529026.1 hypothetical protein CI109_002784 [Kwoniella shandongensis]
MSASEVHLVVLIHGLWAHLAVAEEELEAAWNGTRIDEDITGPAEDPTVSTQIQKGTENLVIMVAGGIASTLTYDGVDVCASRVAWEVDQKVAELEEDGDRVTKFSVMGYSLGGLVARYLIGLLHSRTPSFFEAHHPVSFSTISSPWYGIPRYSTLISTLLCWLGARILSRSGEQLYVIDHYSEQDSRPLLEIMADPRLVFYQGLEHFDRLDVFASGINDNTTPYPTAAIETVDHFLEWQEQGIEVDADEAGIIRSWSKAESDKKVVKKNLGAYVGTLPPVLRYPFPFNYIILLFFPILLPILVILIFARQSLDTRRSKRRLQELAQTSSAGARSPIPSASGLSIQGLRDAIRRIERNLESDLIESAETPDIFTHIKAPVQPHEVTVKLRLKDAQLRMAMWLNALPLKKHITWWPEIRNAHATIVVR